MEKFKYWITLNIFCLIPFLSFSQIPTIKSVGGDGINIDWPKEKAETERKEKAQGGGPGFFYYDCDRGVTPIRASSTLSNQGNKKYGIKNINDYDPMTAWVEGNPDYGIGEFFEIKAPGINVIYNGYQSSPKNWIENSRVKKFKVYKNNVALCYLELTDEMGRQSFELPGHNNYDPAKEYIFKFQILDVYKGTKWQDVAISEINLGLCCVSESTMISNPLSPVSVEKIKEGLPIYSVNMETSELSNTKVLKVSKQRHLSMLKINCGSKELELTSNHPIYIKDFGFSSINKYIQSKNITKYADLVNNIELGIWDESKGIIYFEKLTKIELIEGVFETYTIAKLKSGNTFIANGFISRTY
jgi:hypothetical protein